MEIYYTDTSETAGHIINNNNHMNLIINNDNGDDEEELQYYEFGAHFRYKDLVARLNTIIQSSLQEDPTNTFSPNKATIQITKSRNTTTNQMKLIDKEMHPQNKSNYKNNLYFHLNNEHCKYNINNNNNNCIYNQSNNKTKPNKTNEHSSTAVKQNKKPNQSSLVISSLTVIDKISKLNNTNNHIKAKTNSNSNCSYQNININNKQSSPPSTINNKFIKTNISSIKYQNTNNSSSNKSNPNLILYPSSSKSKSQLKAISELLKSKLSKGKNAVTNSNNISSYTSSNKSRNITKTTNKTVHCILNHKNIQNHNNNSNSNSNSNCFGLQYSQTKPHSVDRKMSTNSSRKITSYYTKPKGGGFNSNGQNTILVSTLNSHNNNNNNTTQSSQYNMDLSITSCMKHNDYCGIKNNNIINVAYGASKSKQIKQKIISVAKNGDIAVNHCSNVNNKMKSSSQQKQKIPSRNVRNSSVIKNTINRTQNSHGCGNNVNTCNCQCKKGNNGNCYSNTINSHTRSKKKLFTNSMNVNHAINSMKNELKAKQLKK